MLEVRLVRCVLVNAVRCILRARLRPVRVRWELVRGFRLRARRVRVRVLVLRHAGLASAMFRAV